MKTGIRLVSLMLVLAVFVSCFAGCSRAEREIKSVIDEFQYCCNEEDIEGMLDTIEPDISDKVKKLAGGLGKLLGKDTSDMLESLFGLIMGDLFVVDFSDFCKNMILDVQEITVDEEGEKAVVSAIMTYEMNGETYSEEVEIKCVYDMEQWYISRISRS